MEDFAEPEAGFLGSIPLARACRLPQELLGSLRDGSLQRSNDADTGYPLHTATNECLKQ